MYIAFKWLVGLASTMWIAMCAVDVCVTKNMGNEGIQPTLFGFIYKNITVEHNLETIMDNYPKDKQQGTHIFHLAIFLSGALMVSIFHRKNDIISFTKSSIPDINVNKTIEKSWILINTYSQYFKIVSKKIYVVNVKIIKKMWVFTRNLSDELLYKFCDKLKRHNDKNHQGINIMLLKKLKEIGEERKNLGQLLIAAIQENKNVRMHYQLENMAKNRLVRHIENTQKEIKENRSRYVSFQQLYLVTHQENAYLKSRIRKLAKDKEDAERNLMEVMNEVYKSRNNELKVFCSRFIVKTKNNLLNSDVNAEIQNFLQKSKGPVASTSNHEFSKYSDLDKDNKKWPSRVIEILHETDDLIPLNSEAPKLKGLPGEYVWTVKDKHGIIEKLYEYDYESNINEGDTIKRIRQYSVYYDKDCLLDFSGSNTAINNHVVLEIPELKDQITTTDFPTTRHKFLTGSEAFQKFLKTNRNVVSSPRSNAPSMLCG